MKKLLTPLRLILFFFSAFLLTTVQVNAQKEKKYLHDENYYEMYPHKITARIYVSQKYTDFTVPTSGTGKDLEYRANAKRNLGIGVTWHNYSLNAFYGFSFLNKNGKEKGKTKGLNLQFHLYPHKWAIDLYAVLPKGEYLHPKGYAAANTNSYYFRPDVKSSLIGASAYKVPNKEKFSYRAAIVQNEWQKKSAGSFLYGGEIYHGTIQGDSALVPKSVQAGFTQAGLTEVSFWRVGPGGGYAYTLVMDHHFFIMASLVGNINFTSTKEETLSTVVKKSAVSPSLVYKGAIGYNSNTWALVASVTGSQWWLKGASTTKDYLLPIGAFRVSLSKKFDLHKNKHS